MAIASTPSWAGKLWLDSSLELDGAYNSNPSMVPAHATAGEGGALTLDTPVSYTGDVTTWSLEPRIRVSKWLGSVELIPAYQYVDGVWKWQPERDVLNVSADWHHDSTLYYPFENAALNGHNTFRTELDAAASWQHDVTELSYFDLSASYQRVLYDITSGGVLSNFDYYGGSAQLSHSFSELLSANASVSAARYELPGRELVNGTRSAQVGVNSPLSERWAVSAQIGYSHQNSESVQPTCCLVSPTGQIFYTLERVDSASGFETYSVGIDRASELLKLHLAATRSIAPSGLGSLSVQNAFSLYAGYPWSERTTVSATVHATSLSNAVSGAAGTPGTHEFTGIGIATSWQWTDFWTLQTQLSYDRQRQSYQSSSGASLAAFVSLTGHFGHVSLLN